MMLVLEQLPPAYSIDAEDRLTRLYDDLSTSQGDDGRFVAETLRQALVHWFDRAQWLLDGPANDDLELQPIQLRKFGTMRVTYRPGGRLRALPYDFGDE